MNVVTEKRKSQARKHASRTRTCACGKVCRGNGGWSSHKRACAVWKAASAADRRTPIDMILNCPACGLQHIDAPDERTPDWKNEPHRSHLCHGCGHIWRPADVPTNGVAAIKTKGKADSPIDPRPVAIESLAQRVPLSDEQIRALVQPMDWPPSVTEIVRAVEQAHGITTAAQED